MKKRVLIAGIGSGSLGLELLKCFALSSNYDVFGVDINSDASGLTDPRFENTEIISRSDSEGYVSELMDICERWKVDAIAPGAEITNQLISKNKDKFTNAGLVAMVNAEEVVSLCSDKILCNDRLSALGFQTCKTFSPEVGRHLASYDLCYPCIVKPARDSGGSNMVFLAENEKEALFFIEYIESRNLAVCVQEYIEALDEYTVGVLSSRDGRVISSIALKRNLSSKLSRAMSYGNRVISSGWSQGVIEEFPDICDHAEKIAKGLGSAWALNIQGRVKDGIFVPFEVNARHSGTSYMRALAGINEPVIALDSIFFSNVELSFKIRRGSYMRILTEKVSFY